VLLDINVLLALVWPDHSHQSIALSWFKRHAKMGWASCALTQAGLVRLLSQPQMAAMTGNAPLSMSMIRALMNKLTSDSAHQFLSLDFGIEQVYKTCTGGIQGHRQITDAYLLTLAAKHQTKLVTFDTGIASLLATSTQRRQLIELLPVI
jgi:toxin-antitoxin system PIN domain toxin